MSRPPNPAAFPYLNIERGMTLRDYFAAKWLTTVVLEPHNATVSAQEIAEHCYRMADAMLAERAK